MKIRLLIADDHEVIRTGLVTLLEGSNIQIVGQAATGNEAVQLAEQLRPDVVLLDIRMPDGDGLEALEKIRAKMPKIYVVMLSTYDNPTYVARAVTLGAADFVLKGATREALIETIVTAAEGKSPSRIGELKRVANAMKIREIVDDDEVPLTQRETQVLRHLALGLSNKEIARSLDISVETVKEHVQNLLRKTALADRTQAAVWAVRKGLV
jgi:DNA-binding NarL/FixJ family response regulator